ncbi:MAG TPA: hypothetical protein VFF69_14365 [Phycisphaerales bacterium]|nr:hypothetical protein [Phycisphaerales bacterium]
MTNFGPSIASSLAGAPQAEQQAVSRTNREERERARVRKAGRGDPDVPVDQVELTDAVRSLKDNTQEEASEDRQEHPQYGAGGRLLAKPDGAPRLDIQG